MVVALILAAVATAKTALGAGGAQATQAASPVSRPRHPFLIMNPRSGGGKVAKFGLNEKAERWAPKWHYWRARAR